MGCLEDRRQESHGLTTRPCLLLQLRQLSTRQQLQRGQNWDKMVSYHPRKNRLRYL